MMKEPFESEMIAALDPGIRNVVKLLRRAGFDTTDSGDGKSKADLIATGDAMDVPHVWIHVPADQDAAKMSATLAVVLMAIGVEFDGKDAPGVMIEATYSPIDRRWTLSLFGLDDEKLRRAIFTKLDCVTESGERAPAESAGA